MAAEVDRSNEAGQPEQACQPVDDLSIEDKVWVLRRVHPAQVNAGRPDSSVFKSDPNGVGTSVTLCISIKDLEIVTAGYGPHGVVAISVGELRKQGFGITYTFEEGNPHHCEVFGQRGKSLQRQLSARARWVIRPDGVGDDVIPELFNPLG